MNNQDIIHILETAPNRTEMIADNYSIDDLLHNLKLAHAFYTTNGYMDMMLGHKSDINDISKDMDDILINTEN